MTLSPEAPRGDGRTRLLWMTGLAGFAFLVLLSRLYQLQILQGEEYRGKAEENFVKELRVPADIYGVGSWLLSSCDVCGTNTDFTADIVRVKIHGRWYDMAKTGRRVGDNPRLERADYL